MPKTRSWYTRNSQRLDDIAEYIKLLNNVRKRLPQDRPKEIAHINDQIKQYKNLQRQIGSNKVRRVVASTVPGTVGGVAGAGLASATKAMATWKMIPATKAVLSQLPVVVKSSAVYPQLAGTLIGTAGLTAPVLTPAVAIGSGAAIGLASTAASVALYRRLMKDKRRRNQLDHKLTTLEREVERLRNMNRKLGQSIAKSH